MSKSMRKIKEQSRMTSSKKSGRLASRHKMEFEKLIKRTIADTAMASSKPSEEYQLLGGDEKTHAARNNHIKEAFGIKDISAFHEIISDLVHLDVLHIPPTKKYPFHIMVTDGMSNRPMTVPLGQEKWQFAEVFLCLPIEWPVSDKAFKDEKNYWPIRLLKEIARFPHQVGTWLAWGHTWARSESPRPIAKGISFTSAILLPPQKLPRSFFTLKVDAKKTIYYLALIPIFTKELRLKLSKGLDEFLELANRKKLTEVLDVHRKCLV